MLSNETLIRMCRARDMLREIHDRPLSVNEVAREAALSPYHFIRRFASLFGMTPHEMRICARLDRARQLLIVGDRSVTDICMLVGCSSLGSFSDLFARKVGVAPSAYRRRYRALVQIPGTLPRMLIPGCFSLMYGIAN